ncbi:MAG: glycoside hydrolase, partial [Spirochaetota bacterium]|nr:glycoside hydrolase [Spirochaetota bacterium]
YSQNQLNWILGLNPFDICMVQGFGRNNPEYEKEWRNFQGGIVNGITSGYLNENDIDFLPPEAADKGDHRWRWSEQWLPHAVWYLIAISQLNSGSL